ncbi:MAG: DUF1415 family protein [Saprospiraceae bacterium]|nr:DUF1415 family protein [Saprospiraceae bacterium]
MENEDVKLTKLWIERFVIGLKLCPFAHYSFYDETIYYNVSPHIKLSDCKDDALCLIEFMSKEEEVKISNAFLILNSTLSFNFVLDLKSKTDTELKKNGLEGLYQTVVFHPDFQFGDEVFHAPGNYVNRSPLPMLHVLRSEEVERAIEATPDVDSIPFRNKELLEKINLKKVSEVFEEDFIEKNKAYI